MINYIKNYKRMEYLQKMSGQWPIKEVVAEFFFNPASSWDSAIPGLMYAELKDQFPIKEQRRILNTNVNTEGKDIRQQVQVIDRLQMYSNDRLSLVQVNQHLLTINRLQPYISWEEFEPLIDICLKKYISLASPVGLNEIGLLFINEFEFDNEPIELERYFNFYPKMSSSLSQVVANYVCTIQQITDNPKGQLTIDLRNNTQPNDEKPSALLNLRISNNNIEIENSIEWMHKAHQHLNSTFKGIVTESFLSSFKGDA